MNNTDYTQISKLIKERQSFYPAQMDGSQQISNDTIWKLLENANYAPSHKRTEPWRYIIFSEESLIKLFEKKAEIYQKITKKQEIKPDKLEKFQRKATTLSHVIAICMKRDPNERIPVEEEEWAVACSVQNMLLTMKSLGIIGYWGSGKIAFSKEMKEYLNLEEQDKCMGFIQLGVPKKGLPAIPKKQMSSIQQKTEWRS